MITYTCPRCGAAMSSPDSLAGQKETCPECGNVTIVTKLASLEKSVKELVVLEESKKARKPWQELSEAFSDLGRHTSDLGCHACGCVVLLVIGVFIVVLLVLFS